MTALIPVIRPWVNPVVRPYFWTDMPSSASVVEVLGLPYPSSGVSVSRSSGVVSARAASMRLEGHRRLAQNAMGSYAYSVPTASSGSRPPSTTPGCRMLSPVLPSLLAAYTWLLLSAYTRLPSVTRAPMVPAVTLGCPVLTPMGTGRGKPPLGSTEPAGGSSNATMGPVTSSDTSTPATRVGRSATPGAVR